jgi:hypothetical protein
MPIKKWKLFNDGIGYVALVPDIPFDERKDGDQIEDEDIATYVNDLEMKIVQLKEGK